MSFNPHCFLFILLLLYLCFRSILMKTSTIHFVLFLKTIMERSRSPTRRPCTPRQRYRCYYYFAADIAADLYFDCTRCYIVLAVLAVGLFSKDQTEAAAPAPGTPTFSARSSTFPYTTRGLDLTFLTNSRRKNATLACFRPLKS